MLIGKFRFNLCHRQIQSLCVFWSTTKEKAVSILDSSFDRFCSVSALFSSLMLPMNSSLFKQMLSILIQTQYKSVLLATFLFYMSAYIDVVRCGKFLNTPCQFSFNHHVFNTLLSVHSQRFTFNYVLILIWEHIYALRQSFNSFLKKSVLIYYTASYIIE